MKLEREQAALNLTLYRRKERKSKFFELGLSTIVAITLPVIVVAGIFG